MAPTPSQKQQKKAAKLASSSGHSSNKKGRKTKARVERYLKSTDSQVHEKNKYCLLLQGMKSSSAMQNLLKELRSVQSPNVRLLTKKNQIVLFDQADGQHSLEFLCTKNDCSLFAMTTSNKKRPNNLVIGRTFDRHVLDMCELNVLSFRSMVDYGGSVPKKRVGSKPLLLFVGDIWQHDRTYGNLQNLFTDFYRGDVVEKMVLSGVDHVIVFTVSNTPSSNDTIDGDDSNSRTLVHQRTYFCKLKKNPNSGGSGGGGGDGGSSPLPYLTPCGPDYDFRVRRTQWAEPDLYKASRKYPSSHGKSSTAGKTKKKSKQKNLSTNVFGETLGRLHMEKQDVMSMKYKKVKAIRRAEKHATEQEKQALEKDLQQEMDQEEQDR